MNNVKSVLDYYDERKILYVVESLESIEDTFTNIDNIMQYNSWKKDIYSHWHEINITQGENLNNITIDAGNNIDVNCEVNLPQNISPDNVQVQVYYGKISINGVVENVKIFPMTLIDSNTEERKYKYTAKLKLLTGGNYGYTFRVMPKHEMLLDAANLDLIKWITK